MSVQVLPAAGEWGRFGPDSPERAMLEALGRELGTPLRPATLLLEDGTRVETEGIDAGGRVIVQVAANAGAYRPAHRNKVLADLFKLVWLRGVLPGEPSAVLLATPTLAPALGGWVLRAARDSGVLVMVVGDDGSVAAAP